MARTYPGIVQNVRGLGLMIGIEFAPGIPNLPGDPSKTQAIRLTSQLQAAGLLVIPAGASILRLLPALNLTRGEAAEGLRIVESVIARLVG